MDIEKLLDPDVAAAIAQSPLDMSTLSTNSLGAIRALVLPAEPVSDGVERFERQITVGPTDPDVTVSVHRPSTRSDSRPALLWIHGGGFVMGTAAMDYRRLDMWAAALDCIAVSVDYRLAPDTPYPGALDDCYAALGWIHDNVNELGVDADRIGVGGISAGGGLAAATALAARDRGELAVAFQCLVYPMLDDRMQNPSNAWDSRVWPPSANRFGWNAYLGALAGGDVPSHAAPSRATDLRGLPPSFLAVGALDGFVDEDVDYAQRLGRAGVPIELHVYPGACHGLDSMAPMSRPGVQMRRDLDAWLERAMRGDFAVD